MFEKPTILLLIILYLAGFISRNLIVKKRTGKTIRAKDILLMVSIVLSSCNFTVILLSVFSKSFYELMLAVFFLRNVYISFAGYILFASGLIIGWIASVQLKDSWRVGILKNQRTRLIQNGLYAHIRNPYFLSYFIVFLSLFLIRPSLVILLLNILVIRTFHLMVLNEEKFLYSVHGEKYGAYQNKTGRYFPKILLQRFKSKNYE